MMISNLIVTVTLLMNAGAVLNFKLNRKRDHSFDELESDSSIGDRLREFLHRLQAIRIFIAIWNVFIIICMFLFFGA
ncbi:small integral membrane protein 7-like [Corticium candelabrum]|uniref:small integral membrane protein 7-like n=1 Tax=Corticium candelabrum TaxID=121492 RepID=UPI002E2578B6|nr:small integral membrane protein 7-like [Corticium candelabrum]